jgi:hypothetical protein|tara:strand:- start:650 stop:859 length:210 start_codon:yes stop_codon:yes gene_type:complete
MNIVEQLKYRKVIELIKKENFIELDNYFKYSGKNEINNRLVSLTPNYRIDNSFKKVNDMTKYKLKNYNK